jgi:hypothetical protein
VVGLLLAAVASVLYISNVIAVGRLAAEVGVLEEQYRTVVNEQEILRAQIARLSGLERMPGWLTIEQERVDRLRALSETAGTKRSR